VRPVTTSSIRSRILKVLYHSYAGTAIVSHNIVDPFEDTESDEVEALKDALDGHNIVDPFEDTERDSADTLAIPPGRVTTSSIRSRILKGRLECAPERVHFVTTSSIRSRILKASEGWGTPPPPFMSQHRRSVRGY